MLSLKEERWQVERELQAAYLTWAAQHIASAATRAHEKLHRLYQAREKLKNLERRVAELSERIQPRKDE